MRNEQVVSRKQITSVPKKLIMKMVKEALLEDIDQGDITALLVDKNQSSCASVISVETMVMCGRDWVNEVFRQIDPSIKIHWHYNDGDIIEARKLLFKVEGNSRHILSAERSALNFLQLLSAISTKTNKYVQAVKETNCIILDTRKTIPGFRLAQKYAVICGGGMNHRSNLFDSFLIKENHISACHYSITKAVKKAMSIFPQKLLEVEVENFNELHEALRLSVDFIMLDNFSIEDIRRAVRLVGGRAKLEASGNISLSNVNLTAKTGVDFISVGALTKDIQAIDLSMRFS